MSIRLPRPLKAASSLWEAWTDPRILYRLEYTTADGETGVLLWFDNERTEPTIYSNTHEVTIPEHDSFVITKRRKTELNGESIPVFDVAKVETVANPSDYDSIELPSAFQGTFLPVIES